MNAVLGAMLFIALLADDFYRWRKSRKTCNASPDVNNDSLERHRTQTSAEYVPAV